MARRTSTVLRFESLKRGDAHRAIAPNLDVISALIETATNGKAIRVAVPDGWTLEKCRGWFAGSPLRYAERRGLTLRTKSDPVNNYVFVWAQKHVVGQRDALDQS